MQRVNGPIAASSQDAPAEVQLGPQAQSRYLCAYEFEEIVGFVQWSARELVLPAGTATVADISKAGVVPTHRGRGIREELMRRFLEMANASGLALTVARANGYKTLYEFGFGVAVEANIATIDASDARIRFDPAVPGRVRYTNAETIRRIAPEIRGSANANAILEPTIAKSVRDATPSQSEFVVYSEDENALGYASFILEHRQSDLHPTSRVNVVDFVAATPSAEIALWQFLLQIDPAGEIYHARHSRRSALLWMLADPRKLSLVPYDLLWGRVVNPANALAERKYSAKGEVAIEIIDDFSRETSGTYLLNADAEGWASCRRTNRNPDTTMPISALGAIYMGEISLRNIARAGAVVEHQANSVALVDTMFANTHGRPQVPVI